MPTAKERLAAYVEAHNAGVRTGDFAALAELLHPTASMRFSGTATGPFDSAAAILQAFREQPPDDELVTVTVRATGEHAAEAVYAWASAPSKSAGRLRISTHRDLISKIRIDVFE